MHSVNLAGKFGDTIITLGFIILVNDEQPVKDVAYHEKRRRNVLP